MSEVSYSNQNRRDAVERVNLILQLHAGGLPVRQVAAQVMSRHSVLAGSEAVEDLAQNQYLVLRQMRTASDD